jgi:hypothetical protein
VALLRASAQSSLFAPLLFSPGSSFLAKIAKLPKTPRRRKDVALESYQNTIRDLINTLLAGLEVRRWSACKKAT